MKTLITVTVLVLAALAPPGSASPVAPADLHTRCHLPRFGPGADYHPAIRNLRLGPHVDNPWFPLRPGTTFVYEGSEGGANLIDVLAPSRRTKVVDGIRARVVHDRLYTDGVLSERTSDYYAQDRCGNVWYVGEDTAELDRHGRVTSREGTWHSGVHGGQPGVYMQAHPHLDRKFRQEWAPGVAEDKFKAISRHAHVDVPYGSFRHALRTRETTALEPGVVDHKAYVRGVGDVVERTVKGGSELLRLVDVLR
jgi:hypothetical protein